MSSESLMYKVLFDYDAEKDDELTIRAGDIIENVVVKGGGWASGHCRSRDRVGMFPLNHVRYVSTSRDNLCDDAPDIGPLSLDSPPPETYRVIYNFTPTIEEELQLSVGSIIELLEKNPSGWWRGRLDGREGLFPSNFVVGPISQPRKEFLRSQEVSQSPVVLRRSTSSGQSNIKSFHASIDQNIGAPLNSKLFDPEDEEPMRPEFGSISSQLDWSTASLSSFKKPGFFGKIKQTFTSTRSLFPKLLSAKNSSTSLNDRLSISSMSFRKRRNSFASFFNKSSTKLPQHSPGAVSQINHSAMFPGYKINSPLLEETTPRKKSLGDLVDRSPRDPEQSMSWIFEEPPESPAEAGGRSRFQSGQTDSGVKDMDFESPEEIFGPITEITDEVFEGIFDNDTDDKKAAKSSLATPGKEQDRSKIRTSLPPLERRLSFSTFRGSSIRTNPNVSWKPKKKEEVTEL